MADDKRSKPEEQTTRKPTEEKQPVKLNLSQYRSMILSKLRADIDAKRAAYEFAKIANSAELEGMSYWKMAYYKMAYWKMGSIDPSGAVINPATGAAREQK